VFVYVCVECTLVADPRGRTHWDVDADKVQRDAEDAASAELARLEVDDASE
jgi:hypothetical protein